MNLVLPLATHIRIDDVAWFDGRDRRYFGRPSSTGMPRFHHPLDVRVVNEIGKALNTHIHCNLVIGEWDIKNRLRGVPHMTWDEAGWDAKGTLDKKLAEACFAELESSEFIDYGLHGLMHGYYVDGKQKTEAHHYPFAREYERGEAASPALPIEEFELLVDLFFKIMDDWGFKKPVTAFGSPNGSYGMPSDDFNIAMARVIYKRGIRSWKYGWPKVDRIDTCGGVACMTSVEMAPWNAYDIDPALHAFTFADPSVRRCPDICTHWPNFLRYNPENNLERVEAWKDYFLRITSPFGMMLARDVTEAASQTFYSKYASVETVDGGYRIGLDAVDTVDSELVGKEFYVSLKGGEKPVRCEGGSISLHEKRADHTVYRIARSEGAASVRLFI
ncbi:MAG: hypothetical protein J6J66_07885 [Clostridia bacterium]|nr:hypothetical protein [Clostridia bacterium]